MPKSKSKKPKEKKESKHEKSIWKNNEDEIASENILSHAELAAVKKIKFRALRKNPALDNLDNADIDVLLDAVSPILMPALSLLGERGAGALNVIEMSSLINVMMKIGFNPGWYIGDSDAQTAVFVSDFHMADGSINDDFAGTAKGGYSMHMYLHKSYDEMFNHFVEFLNNTFDPLPDLVLLGDVVDFWSISTWREEEGKYYVKAKYGKERKVTKSEMINYVTAKILKAHKLFFKACKRYKGQIYYVRGNHDYEVAAKIAPHMNARMCDSYTNRNLLTYATHGHVFDQHNKNNMESFGRWLVQNFLNGMEKKYPNIDNVRPENVLIKYMRAAIRDHLVKKLGNNKKLVEKELKAEMERLKNKLKQLVKDKYPSSLKKCVGVFLDGLGSSVLWDNIKEELKEDRDTYMDDLMGHVEWVIDYFKNNTNRNLRYTPGFFVFGHTHLMEFFGPSTHRRNENNALPTYINTGTWTKIVYFKNKPNSKTTELEQIYHNPMFPYAVVALQPDDVTIEGSLFSYSNSAGQYGGGNQMDNTALDNMYRDMGLYRNDERSRYSRSAKKMLKKIT